MFLPKVQQATDVSVVSFVSMSIVENTRLSSNDILLNVSASHISQCMKKCSETTNCTSFNVIPKTASERPYECQFLSLNKYADGSLLESYSGCMHISMLVIICLLFVLLFVLFYLYISHTIFQIYDFNEFVKINFSRTGNRNNLIENDISIII